MYSIGRGAEKLGSVVSMLNFQLPAFCPRGTKRMCGILIVSVKVRAVIRMRVSDDFHQLYRPTACGRPACCGSLRRTSGRTCSTKAHRRMADIDAAFGHLRRPRSLFGTRAFPVPRIFSLLGRFEFPVPRTRICRPSTSGCPPCLGFRGGFSLRRTGRNDPIPCISL